MSTDERGWETDRFTRYRAHPRLYQVFRTSEVIVSLLAFNVAQVYIVAQARA